MIRVTTVIVIRFGVAVGTIISVAIAGITVALLPMIITLILRITAMTTTVVHAFFMSTSLLCELHESIQNHSGIRAVKYVNRWRL